MHNANKQKYVNQSYLKSIWKLHNVRVVQTSPRKTAMMLDRLSKLCGFQIDIRHSGNS
jgi:hypothetical protein